MKKNNLFCLCLAMGLILLTSTNLSAQSAATIYEHSNYKGAKKTLSVGNYNVNSLSPVGNDKISSIYVRPGYKLYVYEHANYKGGYRIYSKSAVNINTFNDRISSIKVVRTKSKTVTPSFSGAGYIAVIYSDASFKGKSMTIKQTGNFDTRFITIGNDQMSSIKVKQGYEVVAYEHAGFRGASKKYKRNTSFASTFNDKMSSFVVRRVANSNNSSSGTRNNNTTGERINSQVNSSPNASVNYTAPRGYTRCVYENGTYRLSRAADVAYGANGRFKYKYNQTGTVRFNNQNFGDPAPSIKKAGYYKYRAVSSRGPNPNNIAVIWSDASYKGQFMELYDKSYNTNSIAKVGNDKISSITVRKGWKVVAYEHANFKGNSKTYTRSISFLGGFNDKISSLKVMRIGASSGGTSSTAVTGNNVRYVSYTGLGGNTGGYFKKVGNDWYEYKTGKSGVHAKFRERAKTNTAVILIKTDGARIELDLKGYRVKVNGNEIGTIRRKNK